MPLLGSRKRCATQADDDDPSQASTPEPATQRRRTNGIQRADSDDEAYGDEATQGDSNQDAMVKKMVRLALACEYQRKPIRRVEIGEKVLGNGASRQFRAVFERAQMELRSVFGMEMVELPGREKVTTAQKRAAAKSQNSQSKTITNWILISVLPSEFHDPQIIPPPAVPTSVGESQYVAVYTILVSLIMLSGGQLQDSKMERHLRRLGMEDNTPLSNTPYSKTEALLKRLEKENYIVKVRESHGAGNEDDVFWIVGPRGKIEVGEDGVRGLAKMVYGDLSPEEVDELERKIARSLGMNEKAEKRPAPSQPKKRGRSRRDVDEAQDDEEEIDYEDE